MTNTSIAPMMTDIGGLTYAAEDIPLSASTWHEHHFRAMNTAIDLTYYGQAAQTGAYIQRFFEKSEQTLSRFRSSSELFLMNGSEKSEISVSAELYQVLETAKWANRATEGLFEPAILDDLQRAGYDRSFEQVPAIQTTREAGEHFLGRSDRRTIQSIYLDPATRRVRRPVGLRFDLGGIGKGWTVDRCADILYEGGPFLLNAGGDLYAYGTPAEETGWQIEIEDAYRPERNIATLTVSNVGVATSTVVKRSWQRDGQRMHHIIDPRSGHPAMTDLLSVTVVASRVALAEVYAKSALILGSGDGLEFLAMRGVEGILQADDGTVHTTQGIRKDLTFTASGGYGKRVEL